MKYFLYTDIYRAKINDSEFRKYFKMAMEDIGIDHMYLDKHSGNDIDYENVASKYIKKDIFNSNSGYLYVFTVDNKLSESKLSVLKNSLIMNIMGVVDIRPEDVLNELPFVVRSIKRMVKYYEEDNKRLEKQYPKIKSMDFFKPFNYFQVMTELTGKEPNKFSYYNNIEATAIKNYFRTKQAQIKLQELLCERNLK